MIGVLCRKTNAACGSKVHTFLLMSSTLVCVHAQTHCNTRNIGKLNSALACLLNNKTTQSLYILEKVNCGSTPPNQLLVLIRLPLRFDWLILCVMLWLWRDTCDGTRGSAGLRNTSQKPVQYLITCACVLACSF